MDRCEECEESDDTQSDNDKIVDEMITVSDSDGLTRQETSRDQIFSTITAVSTPEPIYSSTNYPVQYPNHNNLAIFPPMNGLNINPVFYTNTQSPTFIADDRNVANYEEVSTYSHLHNPPLRSISLLPEIHRPTLPIYSDFQYQPSLITPLPTYSVNEHVPHPFMAPTLPPLSSGVTNSLPEPVVSSKQTITVMQTASQNEPMQKIKKRGRKRLSDNATRIRKANIVSEGNETFPSDISGQLIPKKRGRKRKSSDDDTGKANVVSQKILHQMIKDANLEINETNVSDSQKRTDEILNHNNEEVKIVEERKEEKAKKKRSRKKSETIDNIISDMKGHSLTTGRLSVPRKKCMEELLYKQKNRAPMAFPKGSFLIRYSDLETLDCDQVWCVDNHHMLLKYRLSTHIEGKRRLYLKSQPERFIGWKCEEPWHFYQLTVIERDRDGSKVLILYPDAKELAECREKARRQKQIAEEMKRGVGNSHDADGIKDEQVLHQIDFDEMKEIEKDPDLTQENVEVQMTKEAANAIERFILIPDDDYTETTKEHMAESVIVEHSVDGHMIISETNNE